MNGKAQNISLTFRQAKAWHHKQQFNNDWITEIGEITSFVVEQRMFVEGNFAELEVLVERASDEF